MHRQLRLTKDKDFSAVFSGGRVWTNQLLAVRSEENGLDHNRYGFIVSKRLGNAVARNKVRRRLRQVVASEATSDGWDVIISARKYAAQADFVELKKSVVKLFGRAGILASNTEESSS